MTKREGAIISAHTGILCCNFSDMHKYVEELFDRPVFTHEFPGLSDEIKEKSKNDFVDLMNNLES